MDIDQDKTQICHFHDLGFLWLQNSEGKEDGNFPSSSTFESPVNFSRLALLMTEELEVVILHGHLKRPVIIG